MGSSTLSGIVGRVSKAWTNKAEAEVEAKAKAKAKAKAWAPTVDGQE